MLRGTPDPDTAQTGTGKSLEEVTPAQDNRQGSGEGPFSALECLLEAKQHWQGPGDRPGTPG